MLNLTAAAQMRMKEMIGEKELNRLGIRILAQAGGCCGPSFVLDYSEKGEPGDVPLVLEGLMLFVQPSAWDALASANIDYADYPREGFVITGLGFSSCG